MLVKSNDASNIRISARVMESYANRLLAAALEPRSQLLKTRLPERAIERFLRVHGGNGSTDALE